MNTKKINNRNHQGTNRFPNVDGTWAETTQFQQNSPQSRKQPKFQQTKNQRFYPKNSHNYSKPQNEASNIEQRGAENIIENALVPNESNQNSSYVHTEKISEYNIVTEESNIDSSPAFSPSTESAFSDSNNNEDHDLAKPENAYEHGEQQCTQYNGQVSQVLEIPQNDLNNGCYNNANYEYDYQQQGLQQPSQYYIYQPYQEYSQVGQVPNVTGSPLNSSFTGTPQQQPQHYYATYQPIPPYIYDPQAGSYAPTYSPIQNQPQNCQQTPGNPHTNLSSPQHPSTFLASYQTPPQPAHQLYIQTSNITPPKSLSPNNTPSTNSSGNVSNDRTSNCNSPHPIGGIVPNQINQTPVHNQYIMYNPEVVQNQYPLAQHNNPSVYTPLTPQTYQCNSPLATPPFMMYHQPPVNQGSPFQTNLNSPMMHTPHSANNSTNFTPKYNKYRTNRYNNNGNSSFNKRNFNQKCPDQTPQSTYSLDENIYANSPLTTSLPPSSYEQNIEQIQPEQQMPMFPTNPYCDPNLGMPNTEAILSAAYNNYDGIDSYGEDYGDEYDNSTEENDENLACQVCRGRRMCFCYFLKVRYYKFPSFFDLVDHQYKKWRSTMAKNNLMQHQIMQSPNNAMNNNNNNNINNNAMMNLSPNPMNNSVNNMSTMSKKNHV